MQRYLADLRAIDAQVLENSIVQFRQLLNRLPVSPPRGEAPDERSEKHCRHPFLFDGPPNAAPLYVCC